MRHLLARLRETILFGFKIFIERTALQTTPQCRDVDYHLTRVEVQAEFLQTLIHSQLDIAIALDNSLLYITRSLQQRSSHHLWFTHSDTLPHLVERWHSNITTDDLLSYRVTCSTFITLDRGKPTTFYCKCITDRTRASPFAAISDNDFGIGHCVFVHH